MNALELYKSHSFDTNCSDDEESISKEINISQKLIEIISSTLQKIIKDNKKQKNPRKNLVKFLVILENQKSLSLIIYLEYTNIQILMIVL